MEIRGTGCTAFRKYEIEGRNENLLEKFDAEDLFSYIEGNPGVNLILSCQRKADGR
ncbi:hypothetical protein [Anaerocolumna aminovalerica]|uniref:hypothetical protein n=1 Tax=Anaerocolumna aminovalerica TaxID=1527 RepID=UPI001596C6E7|nr:hypothetical protein [Anaerocolumna aminovalerica]